MNSYCYMVFALVIGLTSIHASASDYAELSADLDGDKKPEIVVASVLDSDSEAEEYKKFSIQIGNSNYAGAYYAADGELPKLTVVSLDRNLSSKQLLVKMQEPLSCEYFVLAYSSKQLIQLLKFQTGVGCDVQINGDGTLGVPTWEGFWFSQQIYRLNAEGTQLTLLPQTIHSVGVDATANKDILLEKAQCDQTFLKQGSKLRVERFDMALHRYFINTTFGTCGWLDTKKMNEYLAGLPWSG
ncbi:MAG: hypothetical protein PHH36_01470 [Sideroxydans sp.]|nr:hypothetical protein [Sideroxydans sp.]